MAPIARYTGRTVQLQFGCTSFITTEITIAIRAKTQMWFYVKQTEVNNASKMKWNKTTTKKSVPHKLHDQISLYLLIYLLVRVRWKYSMLSLFLYFTCVFSLYFYMYLAIFFFFFIFRLFCYYFYFSGFVGPAPRVFGTTPKISFIHGHETPFHPMTLSWPFLLRRKG